MIIVLIGRAIADRVYVYIVANSYIRTYIILLVHSQSYITVIIEYPVARVGSGGWQRWQTHTEDSLYTPQDCSRCSVQYTHTVLPSILQHELSAQRRSQKYYSINSADPSPATLKSRR
jgi:hypothetical protein